MPVPAPVAPAAHDAAAPLPRCAVCGADDWQPRAIIWDELADEWELRPEERAYVDVQQGHLCGSCGMTFRSVALADAVRRTVGWEGTFADLSAARGNGLRVLEVNEAGTLSPYLEQWTNRVLGSYPDVDMQALPYDDASFDLVVHSDTLEHVPDPVAGLAECRRVLRPGGHLVYTIPLLVGRMTRRRDGLPPSYHGSPGNDEYLVVSEYGADFWTQPVVAGFTSVTLHPFCYPASVAVVATR